ncbi:tetratricopeptide repeat protein [Bacteroidota bacterium]
MHTLSNRTRKVPLTVGLFILIAIVIGSTIFYWWQSSSDHPDTQQVSIQRMAVLPFTNIRNDAQTDFLGFALADQIIGSLSYLKNILVRPSTSIRQYQNQTLDLQTAGTDLNVDIILTGNYLKEANTIRLNIELVDVDANEMIWREPIEIEYENTFAFQDIVSKKVIDRLKLQSSQDDHTSIRSEVPQNPLAYEYYLRSISYPSTIEGDLLAIQMLNNSIQLDSKYAPSFSELGYRRQHYGNFALVGAHEISKAEQAYQHALSLNDELLSALWHLSGLYTETARSEKAVELARRMLTINPNDAMAHYSLGYVYRYTGMLEESEKEFDRALEIDPGNPRFKSAGMTYICLGKYEKAVQAFNLDKENLVSLNQKARIFYRQEEKHKAIESLDSVLTQERIGVGTGSFFASAMKAIIEGETETARTAMTEMELANPIDAEIWFNIAEMYGILGDQSSSARALEEGINRGYYNYPFMVSNSFFDSVRSAPEFQQVLELARVRHNTFREQFFSE